MTNNGCNRCCDIINRPRPAYIVLFKGDDSDFEGNQSVDIVIDTELDTTGMKAHFRFMDFVQNFDSIPENKTLSIVFPNAKTSEFPLGAADATLRFEDARGKFRTISNRIHIVVTNSVQEAYDNEDSQSITVTVKGTVTWETIEGKPTFAPVATSGSYNDLTDKPTIPTPVTIDTALSQTSENPVQNKVVAKALFTGFTEWEFSGDTQSGDVYTVAITSPEAGYYIYTLYANESALATVTYTSDDISPVVFNVGVDSTITATRHLVTPTKTSQLTNDGPSSGPNVGHPFATTNQIPAPVDISGKLDGAAAYPAWAQATIYSQAGEVVSHNGRLWRNSEPVTEREPGASGVTAWEEVFLKDLKQDALSSAQLANIAAVPSKANATDLPYRLVTPGEWEFSPASYDGQNFSIVEQSGSEAGTTSYLLFLGETQAGGIVDSEPNQLSLAFDAIVDIQSGERIAVTATRPSLPGHLLDRAGNRVIVTGDTTLTLPALEHVGRLRDFLVRLEISGSTVPAITFQGQGSEAPNGADEITYETDGDEFPVPDEVGTWSYSFTENCVAHKFAVSLKKVNEVLQGGVA